jgi:large subunit ribosomal protein L10
VRHAEKVEGVQQIEADLGRATVAVLAEYRGLTVGQMNRLRRAVREADGRCRVTKNTLARRATTASRRYERLTPMLQGPLALILGFHDPVAIAKVAVKFAQELPKLEIKGALLDGQLLPPAEVKALANLPSREILLAQLLGLLTASVAHLLRTLQEPAARLVRLVDALGERARGDATSAASE